MRQYSETRQDQTSEARVPYWDNVKCLLIFFVVFGHFLYGQDATVPVRLLLIAIYTFHMPAFAFVSGYWSTGRHSNELRSLAPLIVAYLALNGSFMLWAALTGGDLLLTQPYYSAWYLLALCTWRLTVGHVATHRLALPLSVLATLLIGLWPDVDNTFALARTVAFYPFFLAGYRMPRTWGEHLTSLHPLRRLIIALPLVALTTCVTFLAIVALNIDQDSVLMAPYDAPGEILDRLALLLIASLGIVCVLIVTPGSHLPIASTIGANSLAIYLLHRPITLAAAGSLSSIDTPGDLVAISAIASLALLALLGSPPIGRLVRNFLNLGSRLLTQRSNRGFTGVTQALCALIAIAIAAAPLLTPSSSPGTATNASDVLYPRINTDEQEAISDAYTILFAGDLILLEDQVRRAYTNDEYDFTPLFKHTAPYIKEADIAIGVFEGPTAGEAAGYSSGNFDDGKHLWVNYPDEFATAVRDAGFDMVTTANNHLLDRGERGALRTLDVLDAVGLRHVGSYRNASEKQRERVQIIEQNGLRLAIVAYTYGVNSETGLYPDSTFVSGTYKYLTSTIVDPDSPQFAETKAAVEADLAYAHRLACDLVVVLPHWGTQFTFEPDHAQQVWREIFLSNGADIILGDHSHTVQPIIIEKRNGHQTLTCYSPGNYANVYRGHDGDASALVEVYVDRISKEVIGAGVIPLWCESAISGNYRALPVNDILTDDALAGEISTRDLERVDEVHALVTSVMLGVPLDLQMSRPRHLLTPFGYRRTSVPQLDTTDTMRTGTLYAALAEARNVCFAGDSLTEGTRNGGFGWYEPIENLVQGKLTNVSAGGATVQTLAGMVNKLRDAHADLYVIAIGTNDVRYRDASSCAMTSDAYVDELRRIVSAVRTGVPTARFVFVAPWTSTDGDPNTPLTPDEKATMNDEYTAALEEFCHDDGHGFVDPNPAINAVISRRLQSNYLVDHIHPNSTRGIELYARAVMEDDMSR